MLTAAKAAPVLSVRYLAHDLASPLSVIKLNLELLNESGSGTILLKRAFSGLEQIEARLNEELNANDHYRQPVWKLSQLLRELGIYAQPLLAKEQVSLKTTLLADREFSGPRYIFFSICYNLLTNSVAALASKETGRRLLSIRTYKETGHLILEFKDNGPGIPANKIPLLFRKRFTNKTGGHGYGLLAVSRNLQQYFGGCIRYIPQYPRGACFQISF